MVSGFLISPYDHDRIFSGLAIEIRIWSNTCAGTCGLKRFIISWFIVFSSTPLEPLPRGSLNPSLHFPPPSSGEGQGGAIPTPFPDCKAVRPLPPSGRG